MSSLHQPRRRLAYPRLSSPYLWRVVGRNKQDVCHLHLSPSLLEVASQPINRSLYAEPLYIPGFPASNCYDVLYQLPVTDLIPNGPVNRQSNWRSISESQDSCWAGGCVLEERRCPLEERCHHPGPIPTERFRRQKLWLRLEPCKGLHWKPPSPLGRGMRP